MTPYTDCLDLWMAPVAVPSAVLPTPCSSAPVSEGTMQPVLERPGHPELSAHPPLETSPTHAAP